MAKGDIEFKTIIAWNKSAAEKVAWKMHPKAKKIRVDVKKAASGNQSGRGKAGQYEIVIFY